MLKTSFIWIKERKHTSDHGMSHRFKGHMDGSEWSDRHQQSVRSSGIFSLSIGAEHAGVFTPQKKNLKGWGWEKMGSQHIRYTLYTLHYMCVCVWVCVRSCAVRREGIVRGTDQRRKAKIVHILLQWYWSDRIQRSDENSKWTVL